MTVAKCLSFCANEPFAGIEYGKLPSAFPPKPPNLTNLSGRECYCGGYLSALSAPLNASRCDLACDGAAGEICGGALALTLYNYTAPPQTGGAGAPGDLGAVTSWIVVAGALVGLVGYL